ncbi:MAG: DNA alkylation repair protein, partial [Burkholderiales bacterium]|nr:DNA alkylation repair protein [Anaerolineae bacterium]
AVEDFVHDVAAQIEPLELKARVSLIAAILRRYLPTEYPQAVSVLLQTLGPELTETEGIFNDGWYVLPMAQFVEDYGLDHFDISLNALYEITKRNTSEYAVRAYLLRDRDATLAKLRAWVDDPSPHVRRWVSEGTRPRLPWGKQLDMFIQDPELTLALLEHLKADPSLYVRKSVANHLNDIAKDHSARVIDVAQRWHSEGGDDTRWIVRHGLRTLVKQGHPAALAILGYDAGAAISVTAFDVQPTALSLGDSLRLSLTLANDSDSAHDVVVDFRIHFMKANGKVSVKVFKWTALRLEAGQSASLQKTFPLRPITTRTYYPGHHIVDVQINGQIAASTVFDLVLLDL